MHTEHVYLVCLVSSRKNTFPRQPQCPDKLPSDHTGMNVMALNSLRTADETWQIKRNQDDLTFAFLTQTTNKKDVISNQLLFDVPFASWNLSCSCFRCFIVNTRDADVRCFPLVATNCTFWWFSVGRSQNPPGTIPKTVIHSVIVCGPSAVSRTVVLEWMEGSVFENMQLMVLQFLTLFKAEKRQVTSEWFTVTDIVCGQVSVLIGS